ncbi:TolC family protein [Dysgonomonas sp. Marseille-P4361]|uniref:TolC family protein n=1 Tax=Dysgonomonas sp. Marseille-P4361 TaxID=2161820 RepID=UPI000D560A57|nr:TolC family protein [Dysgonomonas sp. Marseille-P4361]
MKKYIILFAIAVGSTCMQAQERWSLRQCVDYAIENNIDLKQQSLNVQNAEIELSTNKNSRLPDLNANANQSFNFGQSLDYKTNTYTSNNASGTNFSISSSIPIFTGFRIPNQIKASEFNLLAATEGLNKAKENLELQVVSLFLDILFKKEILKAYQEQATLSAQQVERTEALVNADKVAKSQLFDMKAQQARDDLNVTMAENDLALSLLNLSQALNLPKSDSFDIEEPVISEDVIGANMSSLLPPDHVYQVALGIKPHIKEAEYNLESSKKNLKVAQSEYWPTVGLGLSYSNGFNHIYNDEVVNASVSDQLKNNSRKAIGISLSIPIFNRFRVRNQVRAAKLNIENQTLALDNIRLALYKEIQQAYQSATSAQAKFISTEKSLEAADEAFKYARERYEVGKSTVFEYNEAQTKLLTSKSDQIQAKYDYIFRSKILDFYQGKEIDIR